MTPTFRKVYRWPHEKEVKVFEKCNVALITDTAGTCFDGNYSDKLMNTAAHKMRHQVLKKHGKSAFRRTFK